MLHVAAQVERDGFQLIPAVDVVGTEAVRLHQGAFDEIVARAGDPADARSPLLGRPAAVRARRRSRRRADRARSGPSSSAPWRRPRRPPPVQASGGIRSLDDARALLAAGAARIVVGTAALDAPDALAELAGALGERLVVAVDARGGRVAVAGWSRMTELSPDEFAERCAEAGVRRLLCTAVDRDGTMAGPDLELLGRVRDRSGLPVLAAGGIRSEEDLDVLASLGLEGAVVGRALLEGRLKLSTG